MTDTLDWHEWPEPEPHRPPVTPHPVPLHESEPGLTDEEVLPLREDWWRGPIKTAEQV
ncbi:hypothetical protein [Acetobacter tropicalis]|uniref:hypothetical protein n=1 Tax=Acetobacter tropicalis TaxID=104102 RepID=UPI000A5EA098|nr:hypothetical protein [Acetobacter tropicalis]